LITILKKFQFFSDNIKLKISLAGPKYLKNGIEYLRIDKSDVVVKIPQLKLHFENLFPNDNVLSNLGNSLVNQNIDMFVRDIEPALQKSLCKLIVAFEIIVMMFKFK
jgi:Haemolymph juvenile hormone binding protein (JHBP)